MNLTKFFKTGMTQVIIVLLAVLILITMGFNKGFDFTGGSVITINCQEYSQTQAENKAKNQIADYKNASISSIQYGNLYDDKTITIKIQFKNNISETTENILNDLYASFGYDKSDIVESNYITHTTNTSGAFNSLVFTNALLGALVALIAVAVYVFARFGIANAFSLIAGTIIDVAMFLSIVAIFRVEISAFVGFAILATTIVSMVLNFMMLSALSRNALQDENRKVSNFDVANSTAKEQAKNMLTYAISFIVTLLLLAIILPIGISGIIFSVALASALSIITSMFITPTLWSFAYVRKYKQPKQKIQVETESEA